LPGSGLRANNCKEIINETGATEIHSSARKTISSFMQYNAPSMNENMVSMGVDEQEVKNMLAALQF
jgi:copper homeostasis protein